MQRSTSRWLLNGRRRGVREASDPTPASIGAVSSADGTDGSTGMGVRFHPRASSSRLRSEAILSMSCSECTGGGPAGPAVDAWRRSGYLGLVPRGGSLTTSAYDGRQPHVRNGLVG